MSLGVMRYILPFLLSHFSSYIWSPNRKVQIFQRLDSVRSLFISWLSPHSRYEVLQCFIVWMWFRSNTDDCSEPKALAYVVVLFTAQVVDLLIFFSGDRGSVAVFAIDRGMHTVVTAFTFLLLPPRNQRLIQSYVHYTRCSCCRNHNPRKPTTTTTRVVARPAACERRRERTAARTMNRVPLPEVAGRRQRRCS